MSEFLSAMQNLGWQKETLFFTLMGCSDLLKQCPQNCLKKDLIDGLNQLLSSGNKKDVDCQRFCLSVKTHIADNLKILIIKVQ